MFERPVLAALLVGVASLRDRVQQGEHRGRRLLASGKDSGGVEEDVLGQVFGGAWVARSSSQVAVDLRMVAPEGQLGEAFHLLPLSLRDWERNGL